MFSRIAMIFVQMLAATQPSVVSPPAHDPCLMRRGETYYCYNTHGLLRTMSSTDLVHWTPLPPALDAMPAWIEQQVPKCHDLWAPDLSYFNGRYQLYYCASTFGTNDSAIGVAFNTTLDPNDPHYHWIDSGGPVITSHRSDDWNALDPNFFVDDHRQPWLVLGSYWSGIKLYRVDPATGKIPPDAHQYALAARPAGLPIEAPFLFAHDGWYYLFVSFDHCCRGVKSDYNIRVGRSRSVTGPYVGANNTPMLNGGGAIVLQSNGNTRGPGHCAVVHNGSHDLLVHHFYDGADHGRAKLQVRPLTWDANDWPIAGEPLQPTTQPISK